MALLIFVFVPLEPDVDGFFEIFELVKLKGMSPENAAVELGVQRGVIDNTVYKVTKKLREIAANPEYQEEYFT